jgi:hypothetical protein
MPAIDRLLLERWHGLMLALTCPNEHQGGSLRNEKISAQRQTHCCRLLSVPPLLHPPAPEISPAAAAATQSPLPGPHGPQARFVFDWRLHMGVKASAPAFRDGPKLPRCCRRILSFKCVPAHPPAPSRAPASRESLTKL